MPHLQTMATLSYANAGDGREPNGTALSDPLPARALERLKPDATLDALDTHEARVSPDATGRDVQDEFERRPDLPGVVIEGGGELKGLVPRERFYRLLSGPYAREIYLTRPISVLLEALPAPPLCLPGDCPVAEAADQALHRTPDQAYDPLLVGHGTAVRVLDARILLLAQSRLLARARRIQEQIHRASKMEAIGQLAGGVAHDFNNLLTVILSGVALVREGLPAEGPSRELLDQVEKAAGRAAALTDQLLGFARARAMRLEPTDLSACLRETVSLVRRTIDPRVEIEVEVPPGLWVVEADPHQIGQVLMNLCINARDAMPQGGRLSLTLANVTRSPGAANDRSGLNSGKIGKFVRVRVEDTGAGIAPDVLPHIFEPFFTTKEPGKGTGLGLAMAYGAVQQHRGWIECHSEVGRGTRFDLYLPGGGRPSAARPAPAPSDPGPSTGTLLVVDDEEMIRNLAAAMLRRHGFEVLLAADGYEACETYQREGGRVGLVLLDLLMPRISGRDTLALLRRHDPGVRVLLCSGYVAETVTETAADGVVGFIQKPYRMQELIAAVSAALRPGAPATPGAG